jgi:hypothetical protein
VSDERIMIAAPLAADLERFLIQHDKAEKPLSID